MLLERFYNDWLSQSSYLLACQETKLAIVVDPNRDVDRYIAAAAHGKAHDRVRRGNAHPRGFRLGRARARAQDGREAAPLRPRAATIGNTNSRSATARRSCAHGDEIDLGQVLLRVRHTPGHTPEHVCFVVTDRAASDRPIGMFSGDFVFVGDVGRPDLLERAANVRGTMDAMARSLFRSLRALSDLPDYLQIWPGHGAGSACGKALGAMPSTTLGYERIANWAFQTDDEDRFRGRGAGRTARAAEVFRDDEGGESRRSAAGAADDRRFRRSTSRRSSARSRRARR